jgi:CRISPR/Cas system Type II protein with McrA/HNH and RuvC-like nuclease domain
MTAEALRTGSHCAMMRRAARNARKGIGRRRDEFCHAGGEDVNGRALSMR